MSTTSSPARNSPPPEPAFHAGIHEGTPAFGKDSSGHLRADPAPSSWGHCGPWQSTHPATLHIVP
eukprot:3804414-Alexandrium_andersonii.AAC.1